MAKFADVLQDLVVNHKLTNVRWAEVGNEPNGTGDRVTLESINILYRALNAPLVARGPPGRVQADGRRPRRDRSTTPRQSLPVAEWIGANMSDRRDAYAEHVYWWYDDSPVASSTGSATSTTSSAKLLPEDQWEADVHDGVRHPRAPPRLRGTKPASENLLLRGRPGLQRDLARRTSPASSNSGLRHRRRPARLRRGRPSGTCYQGGYDNKQPRAPCRSSTGSSGPESEGSPETWPAYHAMSLLFHTTAPGWQILQVEPWDAVRLGAFPTYGGSGRRQQRPTREGAAAYAGAE